MVAVFSPLPSSRRESCQIRRVFATGNEARVLNAMHRVLENGGWVLRAES